MRTFIILGETPSKKNQRIINRRTGKSYPSKRYTEWHKSALEQLLRQKQGFAVSRCKVYLKFYHGDYIKRDSDNGVSSIFDTLTDAGIFEDDNWMLVGKHFVDNDYDKSNPRCEITILKPDESMSIEL